MNIQSNKEKILRKKLNFNSITEINKIIYSNIIPINIVLPRPNRASLIIANIIEEKLLMPVI